MADSTWVAATTRSRRRHARPRPACRTSPAAPTRKWSMCVERARAGALSALAVLALALALAGCRSTPTLAAYQPDPDAPASEPRLEPGDLELALKEWLAGLEASPFV